MQQYELLQRVQEGDKEAREKLILDNIPLVWSMVRRFQGNHFDKEELFQVGMVGLMNAIDRFDMSYQVQFSTYAVPLILGEIKRFLRDDGPMKITRSIMENSKRIRDLIQVEGELTIAEIGEKLDLTSEEIVLALGSEKPVESIYQPVYESGDGEVLLIEQLKGKEKSIERNIEEKELLQQAFMELNETEEELIHLRYFENKTQTEVGHLLSMSQVQVSRMEKKILLKMRQGLA